MVITPVSWMQGGGLLAGEIGCYVLRDRTRGGLFMKTSLLALLTAVMALGWPAPAAAYIDPGGGSMLLQLIVSALAGLAVAIKLSWRRLLGVLGWRRAPRPPDDAQGGEDTSPDGGRAAARERRE